MKHFIPKNLGESWNLRDGFTNVSKSSQRFSSSFSENCWQDTLYPETKKRYRYFNCLPSRSADPDLFGRIRKIFTGSGSYLGYVKLYKRQNLKKATQFQVIFPFFNVKKSTKISEKNLIVKYLDSWWVPVGSGSGFSNSDLLDPDPQPCCLV